MKLEFVKPKDIGFPWCRCNGHIYSNDYKARNCGWVTVDGKRFYDDTSRNVKELIQFSYTYAEWENDKHHTHRCPKCGTTPYRIIPNPYYVDEDIRQASYEDTRQEALENIREFERQLDFIRRRPRRQ